MSWPGGDDNNKLYTAHLRAAPCVPSLHWNWGVSDSTTLTTVLQ